MLVPPLHVVDVLRDAGHLQQRVLCLRGGALLHHVLDINKQSLVELVEYFTNENPVA